MSVFKTIKTKTKKNVFVAYLFGASKIGFYVNTIKYTIREILAIYFVYGNSWQPRNIYEKNRIIPHHTMFARLHEPRTQVESFKKLISYINGKISATQKWRTFFQ